MTMLFAPRPAPIFHSAIAAAFASLSIADRQPEALGHPCRGSRDPRERDVDGRDDPAGPLVDRRRHPEAERGHVPRRAAPRRSRPAREETPPATRSACGRSSASSIRPSRSTTPAGSSCRRRRRRSRAGLATRLRYSAEWPRETSPTASTAADASRAGSRRCSEAGADDEPRRTRDAPRFSGPGPRAKERPKGKTHSAGAGSCIGVVLLFVLLIVWAVASYLVRPQRREGSEQAPARVARQGRPRAAGRPAALTPDVILLLGTDHARRPARAHGLSALRLDHARPHRSRAAVGSATSRSRATCASRSPATASTKINAAYADRRAGARDPDDSADSPASRSTTSSSSTSTPSRR